MEQNTTFILSQIPATTALDTQISEQRVTITHEMYWFFKKYQQQWELT